MIAPPLLPWGEKDRASRGGDCVDGKEIYYKKKTEHEGFKTEKVEELEKLNGKEKLLLDAVEMIPPPQVLLPLLHSTQCLMVWQL